MNLKEKELKEQEEDQLKQKNNPPISKTSPGRERFLQVYYRHNSRYKCGDPDGTRTRDLRRDRAAF